MPIDLAQLTIRPLGHEQLVLVAGWQHSERASSGDPGKLEDRIARLALHIGGAQFPTTYVVFDGDTPMACASLVYYGAARLSKPTESTPIGAADNLWLSNVFVLPEYRCQGVASKLLKFCELQAAKKVSTLYLFSSERADYYRQRGWSQLSIARVSGLDVDILQRSLELHTN